MADFSFLENKQTKKWTILAPRRQSRPNEARHTETPICPFCPGREGEEQELFRIDSQGRGPVGQHPSPTSSVTSFPAGARLGDPMPATSLSSAGGQTNALDSNWLVRVVPNKFPFAKIHEIIIHSPDHHKNIDELPLHHVQLILETYRQRFQAHQNEGQVYIFHNHGLGGGESLPHPHTQLAVLPQEVILDAPPCPKVEDEYSTKWFSLFCPQTSQWPDEVWIAPQRRGKQFYEVTNDELTDLSYVLQHMIQLLDMRHRDEFPFNFYIYPGSDWYIRIVPRLKLLGGLEVGTGVFVNTQNPGETLDFIKEHFGHPDEEKIRTQHQAAYKKAA